MSNELPSTTWRNALNASTLEPTTKVVGMAIASHAYGSKDWGKPSYKTLKEETNIKTDKTIRAHTKLLSDLGWLNITKQKSPSGRYNRYQLTLPVGVRPEVTSLTRGVTSPTEGVTSLPSLPEPSLLEAQPSLLEGEPSLLVDEPSLPQGEVEVIRENTKVEVVRGNTKGTDTTSRKKTRNHLPSLMKESKEKKEGRVPSDWLPTVIENTKENFGLILEEAERRYLFLISLGMRNNLSFLDKKRWFITWVQEDNDPLTTCSYFLQESHSISHLTSSHIDKWLEKKKNYLQGEDRFWSEGKLPEGIVLNQKMCRIFRSPKMDGMREFQKGLMELIA